MTESIEDALRGDREGADAGWVPAPAKLTVSLRVTGVRPDGYHEIDAELVSLDLADSLCFGEGDGLSVEVPADGHPELRAAIRARLGQVPPGPENLVSRALAALGRTASVRLAKRIPAGAGLGGGSSDAAAVLRWAGCDQLELAAGLGADVPFCLVGGHARVTGIGEVLTVLPYEERRFVLLLPPFGVETAAVYRRWDELDAAGEAGVAPGCRNDLEPAALAVEPRLRRWRDVFADVTGRTPTLAGTGSTWFVEGSPGDLGLGGRNRLTIEGLTAPVVAVRTVPGR